MLDAPIDSLTGAGPVTAARLRARGLRTVRDLLFRLPRGYDDLRRATPIESLGGVPDGVGVLVRGLVKQVRLVPRRLLDVVVEQGGATVRARWFRPPPGMAKAFPKGAPVALAGPLRTASDGTRELVHPTNATKTLARLGEEAGLGLRPRYAAIEGVRARSAERIRASALEAVRSAGVVDLLPEATRNRLGLSSLADALVRLHAPLEDDAARPEVLAGARWRTRIEAALVVQLAFLRRRAQLATGAVPVEAELGQAAAARRQAALPFSPTASQLAAVAEIAADLGQSKPMQRLLVGDVGSGKTAVALAAAALGASGGQQTLMMVPTEVLAEQQGRALLPLARRCGVELGVLTGGSPQAARAEVLRRASSGQLGLLIGTQALLGDGVAMSRLGLVVVDEQHRFGVEDRARLGRAGGGTPHLLTMSATPIPRSLALALHGDLDVSFLTGRPNGRSTPATVVCAGPDERRAAYARLGEAIADGRQAFVVCPVRQEARRPGAITAVGQFARLGRELAPARVGLLHGGLASAAKERALRAFADGDIDVLVATTVVELGIDVPNATVIIVEDADRFGLAQLHQLRGRVGRGLHPGICFLCASAAAGEGGGGRARLVVCAEIDDGFRLAEADLAQRGFGELDGTAQAGTGASTNGHSVADVLAEIAASTTLARREAERLLADDPTLSRPEHGALADAVRPRLALPLHGQAG